MKKQSPAQLVKIASNHDLKALAKRAKADKLFARQQKLKLEIYNLTKKADELASQEIQVLASAQEHEVAARDLLNEARLEYTKDMDDPSEVKAQAWETFFNFCLAEPSKG